MENDLNLEQNLEFSDIPRFNNTSNQSYTHSYNSLNDKQSNLILLSQNLEVEKIFSIHLDIPELNDWVYYKIKIRD